MKQIPERYMWLSLVFILIVMLIGSNYHLAEQRKQNVLVVRQAESIMASAKMLRDRQDELKAYLAASEKQRLELLGLWENINPKYREGPDEAFVLDDE